MTRELPLDIRLMNVTSRALLWLFMLGALAVAGNWLVQRPWWAIRSVRVEGNLQHVSATALRGEALPRLQGNFFTVSLAAAQQAFDQVPWVRKAVVQRVWPLSLLVTLEAQQPLAFWSDGSSVVGLVNTHGQLFEANLGEVQDMALPSFSGPAGSEGRVAQMYAELSRDFAPLKWKIVKLEMGAEGNWRVQVEDGPRLDLGSDHDAQAFQQRLQRFLVLAPRVQARYGRALTSADLRYSNGFAVRLAGVDLPGGKPDSKTTQRQGKAREHR
ncbi:MAG: cell division protein FtsQ/DivIB [Thiomonas delicata]|uniref:Cell division protein FtsQ n=1 Tax=Thiomonas delicata TaxID=364030 RepID=A0A238D3D1_THIDL|nr:MULTISPECIES: cell division protein FtsQ/DivIB [Thiomonas]SBP87745.1 Cell division protein FtsQ [Thiomonas delicata]